MRVLQPANVPVGQWFEERVDLAKDYRQAFGENAPDPVHCHLGRHRRHRPSSRGFVKGFAFLGRGEAPPPTH